jgi:LCP family protein required for cell wall assembly
MVKGTSRFMVCMNHAYVTTPHRVIQSVKQSWLVRLAFAPWYDLLLGFSLLVGLGTVLILYGVRETRTIDTITLGQSTVVAPVAPLRPPDFTPLASPPPAIEAAIAGSEGVSETLPLETPTPEALAALTDTIVTVIDPTPVPTVTPFPIHTVLQQEGQTSLLQTYRVVTVLVMGTDARPDEYGASRTDSMMVAVINLDVESVTLISIPRDLWVHIPGYGESRINTAYFMGESWGQGPETARQTVQQVLGIPITHTAVIDFDTFREVIDNVGGVDVVVPKAIDDPLFPTDDYGTYHLQIPAGPNHFDGEEALAYARTRHGSSDMERAARQQQVVQALRDRLVSPDQLPNLPGYLRDGFESVRTSLSLTDMFFLADIGMDIEKERIFTHVIQAPLLWNGVTADGQQVLLYEPYELQSTVQYWLWEASQP